MVLTANFWHEYDKKNIIEGVEEKIIRNDILISIIIPYKIIKVSHCTYHGPNIESYINEIIQLTQDKANKLNILNPIGIDWEIRTTDQHCTLEKTLKDLKFEYLGTTLKMGIDFKEYDYKKTDEKLQYEIIKAEGPEIYNQRLLEISKEAFPEYFKTIDDAKNFILSRLDYNNKLGNMYLQFNAYSLEDHIPIGYASMKIEKNLPNVAYLYGASTDKNYRKRGIYTNLLYKRINYAKKIGIRFMVIDANEKTSAPILAKHGFKIFDKYVIYRMNF